MRYTTVTSVIQVIGKIWMPPIMAAMEYTVRPDDLKDEDGKITRDSIDRWVCLHTGDFQSITDWRADISTDDNGEPLDIVIDWRTEDSKITWYDCMYGSEDE